MLAQPQKAVRQVRPGATGAAGATQVRLVQLVRGLRPGWRVAECSSAAAPLGDGRRHSVD